MIYSYYIGIFFSIVFIDNVKNDEDYEILERLQNNSVQIENIKIPSIIQKYFIFYIICTLLLINHSLYTTIL